MEFDTGPDVPPGHEITYESPHGSVELGAAGYDSDDDGVADSVIVIQDGQEYVITDADHDGTAESLHAYDSAGQEVDPETGVPLDWATPDNGSTGLTGPGGEYDLGHPTTDLNGDGTADTVVAQLSDGTVVGYSDNDGDGTADQVTQISPDGRVMIGVSDGRGGWQQAATGYLGADGSFVPDGANPAATTAG